MSQTEPVVSEAECIMVKDDKPWTPTRRAKKPQSAATRSPSVLRVTPDTTNPPPRLSAGIDAALPSSAQSPGATPNRRRQGMFVERLNAVWGERKWFPPEQFLSSSHNKPLRDGTVSLGPGHMSNLVAITNMALALGMDPKAMYEPGGVLYEAMINNKGVPVWSSKTTIKAHEVLQSRCRAKGISLPGSQLAESHVPEAQPCDKDTGDSQPGSDQEMGATGRQVDGSGQVEPAPLSAIEKDREQPPSAAHEVPVPRPVHAEQQLLPPPLTTPAKTASQSTDTNNRPRLAINMLPVTPTAEQLSAMKHWTEQLILATQYFLNNPPVPPQELQSRFEKAREVSTLIANRSSTTVRESQACREKMAGAKAHLSRKEQEFREAVALVNKLRQLSTPAAQLDSVKEFHAAELEKAREELEAAELAFRSAQSALAMVGEGKNVIERKLADLKVEEDLTSAFTYFYRTISTTVEKWSNGGSE